MQILTALFSFCIVLSFAQKKYWVGESGEWNNPKNWLDDISGTVSSSVPSLQDTIVIKSLSDIQINLKGKNFAKTIIVETNRKVHFISDENASLYITQTFNFPKNVQNQIKGKVNLLNIHSNKIPQKFGVNEFVNLLSPPSFSTKNLLKPLALDISVNVTNVSCHSAKDGEIELTVNNGVGPFTYDWFPNSPPLNGDGTNKVIELDPGLYNVIVTDLFDNTEEVLVDIAVSSPSPITVLRLGSSRNVTCPGGNDGRLNTSVFGGQGPYTFSWNTSPVQTTQNALNLRAGNYQLTVTDATGCVANSQVFTVTQPPDIQANFTDVITVDCNGNCNGEATADVTGGTPGYTYLWYDAANQNTPRATNLCARTYNIRVTDSRGCMDTVQLIMTQPAILTLPYDSTNVTCFHLDNGIIRINPAGGTAPYSYNWLNTPNPETGATVNNLPPGTYNVIVTDFRGCTETAQVNIDEPTALEINITSSTNVLCFNACTGEATASTTGGTTPYQLSWFNVSGTPTTNSVNELCADTFHVAVRDAQNCRDTASIIITQPLDSITTTLIDTVFNQCFGECNGEITVAASGGTGVLSYLWLNVPGNPTTPTATNLCGDLYQVRVTDDNGCRDTLEIEIPSLGLLTGNVVSSNASCGGVCDGSATVIQSGGVRPYSFDWYDLPGGSTDSSLTGLCAGVYNVKITDANGCLDTVEVTITEPPTLSLVLNTLNSIPCKGECNGAVTVTRTGGTAPYNFSWYNTPGNPTTLNYNQFCAGTYNLAVSDGINCTDTLEITITEPALELSSSIIDSLDLRCFGVCAGEAEVQAVGGTFPYVYRWYNAGNQTSSSVNNLCAGTSFVEVTDFNGCKDSSSVILTQPPTHVRAEMIDSLDLKCFGECIGSATVAYSGGIAPYTVDWYNFGNASTDQISNICAGTYFVRVLDNNQCADTVSVNISQPSQLNVFNTSRLPTCSNDCDGILSVVPFGGTGTKTLQWLNIPGNPTSASIPNLCAGNYTLSITDDSLCNRVINVPLINPSSLSISIINTTDVLCKGECTGSATVRGSGGLTPYSFSWTNTPDLGTDTTENNLCVGTYNVSMTDSNGCSISRLVTINEPAQVLSGMQIAMDSTLCFYSLDGEAEVVGLGGTAPYEYNWFTAGNQIGARADSLSVGDYLVKISDFNGCLDTIVATVFGPDTLKINATVRHISCNSTNDGNIKLNPTGGYPPYNFKWLDLGNINTDTVFNLTAGFYNVELTDANNCVDTFEIEVIQTTQVFGAVNNTSNLSCYNSCDGSITVSGTGGLGSYFYDWYDASGTPTTATVNNLCAGTYNVRVYDVAQCGDTLTISLTQPQQIVYQKDSSLVTCNGICDATAEVNFISGDAPLSLIWLNVPGNPTTNSVSNVCFGTLLVQLRDGNNCLDTASIIIDAPTVVQANITDSLDNLCVTDCNGMAKVSAVGGTLPFTYLWNTLAADSINDEINNLCNGVYTVKVTDDNGCIDFASVSINSPDTLQTDFTMYEVSCFGGNDGRIKLNPTGGQAPYTFDWYDLGNLTTDSVSGLTIGTFGVVVTDFNGCTDSLNISVTQVTTLQAQVLTNIPNVCFGENAAQVELGATGGTAPYIFTWFTIPGSPTGTLQTNLFSGNYQVALQDALGCIDTIGFAISPPDSIQYQVVLNGVSCFGECDADITVNVSGGVAPYNYNWYQLPGNPSTNSLQNLCVGTYRLQVTDDNGCIDTLEYDLIGPAVLQANITDSVDNLCIRDCNGMAKVTPIGGTSPYTYLWNTLAADSINDGINNLCNGVYTVKVTDTNGCVDSSRVTINSPDTLQTDFTMYEVSCLGGNDGRIKLNPTGGQAPYTFDWYDLGNLTTDSVSGLTIGTYGVLVTDFNGCTDSLNITVTQVTTLQAQVLNNVPNLCFGGNTAQVELGATGGTNPYVFTWFTMPGSPTGNLQTNLISGNYEVVAQDALGCLDTIAFNITEPDSIQYLVNLNGVSCFGVCDAEITVNVSGGVAPYNYNWYQLPGNPSTNSIQNLCVGTYRLQVTDDNGCIDTLVYNINQPTELIVNTNGTDLTCNNNNSGLVWAEITGGTMPYSIVWDDVLASTNDTVYNLSAREYKVRVTDGNNCLTIDSVEIFEPTVLQASITDSIMAVCSCNGSATVSAQGGTGPYTYLWNDIAAQTTALASNLCATTYQVLVTDANLCSTTVNVTITDTSNFAVNLVNQSNASCFGTCNGSLTVEALNSIAPITYQWNDVANTVGATVNNLCAGNYFVTVTDGNNCIRIENYTITQPDSMEVNFVTQNVSCFGGSDGQIIADVSGGVAPYTHSWNNGILNNTIQNLVIGTYTDTIRDFNNCIVIASAQITQPLSLSNNFTKRDVVCFGAYTGMIKSEVNGGLAPYEYSWNSSAFSSVDSISDIPSGKYILNVKDAAGCILVDSIEILQSSPIVINYLSDTLQVSCSCDAVATPIVTGGLYPYTYQWNDIANQTDSIAINLCAGNYVLTLTDANNCLSTAPVVVEDLSSFRVDIVSLQNETCVDLCNGSISLNAVNGTAPYTFAFNDPFNSTTPTVNNLCPGNYQAIVQDALNCTQVVNFTIAPAVPIQTNLIAQNVSCNGLCDGNIKAEVTGGNGIYTYLWNNDLNSITDSIFNLCPRNYQVIVSDGNNCKDTATIGITQPAELMVSIQNIVPVVCFGDSTGAVSLTVTGGNLPYSFAWNNGETVRDIEDKVAGNYFVTVTDAKNCMDTISTSITQNQKLVAQVSDSVLVDCAGQNTGSITIGVTGGVYPYSYTWLGNLISTNDSIQNNLTNGIYSVIVKDAEDCVDTVTVNLITSPSALQITNVSIQNTTCNTCNGSILAQVTGGTAPYVYSWTNTLSVNNPQVQNLCTGTYTLTVQDDLGCEVDSMITVGVIDSLVIDARIVNSNTNICFGSSSAFAVVDYNRTAGPYTVQWNDPLLQTTDTAFNLSVGTYKVIVSNVGGCKDSVEINVQQGAQIILDSISSGLTSCSGICDGSAVFTATGGIGSLSVLWSNGNTSLSPTNLCEGLNTITVTDDLACTISDSVWINVNNPILANSNVTNTLCFGDCNGSAEVLVIGGGVAPYRHSWSNGATTNIVNALCAGNYTDTVYDFNNCFIVQNIQITQPLQLISSKIDTAKVTCYNNCDGQAKVVISGGTLPYQFNWDNATTDSVAVNLCAGSYIVQVTDFNNCTVKDTVEVLNVDSIKIQSSNIQNPLCYSNCDGFIALTIEGGNGDYTFSWLDNQTTDSIANLCAGSYQVLVQDKLLCNNTFEFIITQPDSINIQFISAKEITCLGATNAQITVNASGGTGVLSYFWNDVAATTTAILNNVDTGSFEVVVTDVNNCTNRLTKVLTDTLVMKLEIDSTILKCFEVCDGSITPIVTGGVYPYVFNWSNASQDSLLTDLCADTYTLTLVDNQNCTIIKNVEITQPSELIVNVIQQNNISCANLCDGKVLVEAQGGLGKYEFKWNNVIGVDSIVSLCANTYSLELKDSNNCLVQQDFIITEPDAISLIINSTNATCNDSKDGEANVIATGGTGVLNTRWYNTLGFEQFTPAVNNLDTGKYYVNVSDEKACFVLDSADITALNIVTADVVSDTTVCLGDTLNLSVSGGISYVWSTGDITSNIQYVPTQNSTLTVTATNNSCSAIASVNIVVNPLPSFTIGASNTVLLKGKTANLSVNPSPNEWVYDWNPPVGLSDPTIANPIANPSESQLYTLQVTNENGCSDTASIKIIVTESIIIPDAITPNNDGYNDIWRIDLIEEFPQSVVEVYNRWGQLVFRSVGYAEKFNGTHNGKDLPVGTYYYVIDLGADMPKYTGPITIMR